MQLPDTQVADPLHSAALRLSRVTLLPSLVALKLFPAKLKVEEVEEVLVKVKETTNVEVPPHCPVTGPLIWTAKPDWETSILPVRQQQVEEEHPGFTFFK